MQNELYIGIMSGTSLDGVDTVLVSIDKEKIERLATHNFPIPKPLREQVLAMNLSQPVTIAQVGSIDHQLGKLYAQAVQALLTHSGHVADDITAIGCHGQTVYHQPSGAERFTIQLGDANLIAAQTNITTIADFRRKDMALGGQGAPLVPAFHQAIFGLKDSSVVILNIGGIANISVLNPDGTVVGYDTGPGNMLMDAWCYQHQGQFYDQDAHWAKQGIIHSELLEELLADSYFTLPAPKSTGREYFHLDWLRQHSVIESIKATDVQRTLCELTAQTICDQITPFRQGHSPALYVCGGGAQNPLLMERLSDLLPHWAVSTTSEQGFDSDDMEAMAFAWLAYRRIHGLPSNLPAVTGACRPASLGVIYYPD